ncbi:hypothetical protein [Staphylococcus gallinarum]|uniref:hypothetical protein n=1 Tax=Staphylococcus gallinarum TaxID=1293 RepID=UPI0030BF91B1
MKKFIILVFFLLIVTAGCGNKVDEDFLEGTWVSQNDSKGKIIFKGDKVKLGEGETEQTYAIASDNDGKFNITFQREETGGVETYYFEKKGKKHIKVLRAVLDTSSDQRLDDVDLNTEYEKEGGGFFGGLKTFLVGLFGIGLLVFIGYLVNKRV